MKRRLKKDLELQLISIQKNKHGKHNYKQENPFLKYGGILVLILLGLLMLTSAKAQNEPICESHSHSGLDHFSSRSADEVYPTNRSSTVITIPVVFHVIYNSTDQNISDAQIQSQIDVLNEDFRAKNADRSSVPSAFSSYIGDSNIEFVLAKRDPSGNSSTGITRKYTSVSSFSGTDMCYSSKGGVDAWPTTDYLNIWVCNKSGAAGSAAYPWGGNSATDGIIVKYTYVGRTGTFTNNWNYKKGRTITHEVGHWLGLGHIWGDATCGSDLVSDTPTHENANGATPTFPHMSSCSPNSNGDMFMNYMDYTYDAVRVMFTVQQAARMNYYLTTTRAGLLTSLGGVSPGTTGTTTSTCNVPSGLSAGSITSSSATLSWASTGASSYNIQYKTSAATSWTTITSASSPVSISGLSAATGYNYKVQSVCSGTTSSYSSAASFTTTSSSSTSTTTCAVPTGLAISSVISNGGTAAWTSSGASYYYVRYKPTSSSYWTTISTSSTSYAIKNLNTNTKYEVQVKSICSGSTSAYSSSVTFTTGSSTTTSTTTCAVPTGLAISSVISNGGTAAWTSSGASYYYVRYKPTSSSYWTTISTSSTSYAIKNLYTNTKYEVQVKSICSGSTSAYSSSVTFTTGSSSTTTTSTSTSSSTSGATPLTVGTGTGTTTSIPYATTYVKQHSQMIISRSELVAAGYSSTNNILNSIAFYVASGSSEKLNGFTIKVAHTSQATFSSSSFLSTSSATTVYTGSPTAVSGTWNQHYFSSAFTYDGMSNLLIDITWNNSTRSSSSSVRFTSTAGYTTLNYATTNTGTDLSGALYGARSIYRPNIQLQFDSSALPRSGDFDPQTEVSAPRKISEDAVINSSSMNISPNPASSDITIQVKEIGEGQQVAINVYSITGNLVGSFSETTDSNGKVSLDLRSDNRLSRITDGIYICHLEVNGVNYTRKFIVAGR